MSSDEPKSNSRISRRKLLQTGLLAAGTLAARANGQLASAVDAIPADGTGEEYWQ